MKTALFLLLLAGVAYCQHFSTRNNFSPQFLQNSRRDPNTHKTNGNSQYHLSWKVNNQQFSGGGAARYCKSLGRGWEPVAISSSQENQYIYGFFSEEPSLKYFWTGGKRTGRESFTWSNGESFNFNDWSHTGFLKREQPDNRDRNENCLGVLKNVYNDGIKWHDVGCQHTKPVLCEKH